MIVQGALELQRGGRQRRIVCLRRLRGTEKWCDRKIDTWARAATQVRAMRQQAGRG